MKKQYLKLLLIEIFLIVFSLLQFLILKQFSIYLYVIEIIGIYAALRAIFKPGKSKNMQKKEALLLILITCLSYYAITYLSGFFLGFVRTTYSKSFLGIVRNVLCASIFIYFLESIREIIIVKAKYYKSLIILSFVSITMVEVLFSISLIQFSDKLAFLQILLSIVIPCLFRNIYLTYSMDHFGIINTLIYHAFMVIPNYIVPVFPNIGDYLSTVLLILHPLVTMFLCSNIVFYKKEKIKDTDKYIKLVKAGKYVLIVSGIVLVILIYLISDIGRFTVMAIGSESMTGTINKGDVVVIDKKKREYKKNDIIAYNYDNTIIVHRIVGTKDFKAFIAYKTKGDANESEDSWISYKQNIKGKVLFRIKYIGWPTVKLSEYISNLNR